MDISPYGKSFLFSPHVMIDSLGLIKLYCTLSLDSSAGFLKSFCFYCASLADLLLVLKRGFVLNIKVKTEKYVKASNIFLQRLQS